MVRAIAPDRGLASCLTFVPQTAMVMGERPSRSAARRPMFPRSGTLSREMTQTRPHMLLRVRRTIVRGSWPTSSSNRIGSKPSPRASNGAQVAL